MDCEPLVSIITPCFNSEAYLPRYLNKIIEQTYNRIQLIIVNDGSTDSTEQIVMKNRPKIEKRGYSLTYVKQENKGLGGAINTGLKYIEGQYFTWCDSDNFYSKEYVTNTIDYFMNNPTCAVVRCDGYCVDDSDITKPTGFLANENEELYASEGFINCLLVKHFHFGCAMVRTESFDEVNPTRSIYPSRAGQNWQLLLPVLYRFPSCYMDEKLFWFVYRKDSISNRTQFESLEAKIAKQNEYVAILLNTLDSIEMDSKERDSYKDMVRIKYAKMRLYFYLYANDKKGVKEEFGFLKRKKALNAKLLLALVRSEIPALNHLLIHR